MAPAISPGRPHALPASADWAASYVRQLNQAAQQSLRVVELSRRVLERIAEGDASAHVIQRTLHDVLKSTGAETGARFVSLYARFVAGVAMAAAGAPASLQASAATGDAASVLEAAVREANRHYEARMLADLESATRGGAGTIAADAAMRLASLFQLQAELQATCSALLLQSTEDCLQALLGALDPDAPSRDIVRASGRRGDRVDAVIAIENSSPDAATMYCGLLDVRRADGIGPAFDPRSDFDPEVLVVEPGAEARVRLSVDLDERFDAGAVYVGSVRIARDDRPEMRLPLEIRVEPETVAAGAAAQAQP